MKEPPETIEPFDLMTFKAFENKASLFATFNFIQEIAS